MLKSGISQVQLNVYSLSLSVCFSRRAEESRNQSPMVRFFLIKIVTYYIPGMARDTVYVLLCPNESCCEGQVSTSM